MVTAPTSRSTELGLQVYLTGGQGDNALPSTICPICPFLLLPPDSHYPQAMEPFAEYRKHLFSRDLDPKTKVRYWQKQRNTALILTLAFTGLRRGELLNLTVGDVDFQRRLNLVRQGKGDKDRLVPMTERLMAPLRYLCHGKATGAKIFAGLNGCSVYRVVTSLGKACGLDGFHPYSLSLEGLLELYMGSTPP